MSKPNQNKNRNKNKAVALRYRTDNDSAPVVVASGYGHVAEKIIDVAERKGIPVFRDDSAASMLCMLDIGRSIPPELYEVVAAIYCRILDISKGLRETAAVSPDEKKLELIQQLEEIAKQREDV